MEYGSDYLGRMQFITYPDGETIHYEYDAGGQVKKVSGINYGKEFIYVENILYDEYGQRTEIQYGNGVKTNYEYNPARRWLTNIKTQNEWGVQFQNINYNFDKVGNIKEYKNDCLIGLNGNYSTSQSYTYDDLYQLTSVTGNTTYNPYNSMNPEYISEYRQDYVFDTIGLGNMTAKGSTEKVTPAKTIGDDLNYSMVCNYDSNYAHRLINVGNRYYKYDLNGNIICEKDGNFEEETVQYGHKINHEQEEVYSTDYAWGYYKTKEENNKSKGYERIYTWNEKNQLIASSDASHNLVYVYGHDGQRTNKYGLHNETIYFNKMWALHTDSGNSLFGGQYIKNIYLGDTRIVTKLNSGSNPSLEEEETRQYYYHSDHLGSATLISDYKGDEYQRIEYTPYGETWVEKTRNTGTDFLPYKFTGKELDEETGLYYYGARYYDARYSRWLSTDPALGEYVPGAGYDSSKLPGMGGVYNTVNLSLYHYAGNNPMRYTDPDGREIWDETGKSCEISQNDTLSKITQNFNQSNGTDISYEDVAKANNIADPDKIYSGNTLDFSSFLNNSEMTSSNNNPSEKSHTGYYSNAGNFLIGFGEFVSGVGIIVGGGFAAAALAPETVGGSAMIGYDAMITGGALSAYGITRMVGENNKPFGEDLKSILVPPMAAFADVDIREVKK